MKDIVDRLRDAIAGRSLYSSVNLMADAADEIERLREQNRRACAVLHAYDERLILRRIIEELRTSVPGSEGWQNLMDNFDSLGGTDHG